MRFAPLQLALALAFLPGCGGGSGFGGSSPSQNPSAVVLSTISGQVSDFAVTPGGTSPLAVAATAYTGSGALDEIVPGVTYTWAARFVNPSTDPPSIATYTVGADPNGFKPCPPEPTIRPAVPILVQSGGGAASTEYPGYRVLGSHVSATQVFIGSVPGVPAPYCLVIVATSVPGSVAGAHTIIVSASP
jgi:hypothetical protein